MKNKIMVTVIEPEDRWYPLDAPILWPYEEVSREELERMYPKAEENAGLS